MPVTAGVARAARDAAAAALLLAALVAGMQWLLRRVYGEREEDR